MILYRFTVMHNDGSYDVWARNKRAAATERAKARRMHAGDPCFSILDTTSHRLHLRKDAVVRFLNAYAHNDG